MLLLARRVGLEFLALQEPPRWHESMRCMLERARLGTVSSAGRGAYAPLRSGEPIQGVFPAERWIRPELQPDGTREYQKRHNQEDYAPLICSPIARDVPR